MTDALLFFSLLSAETEAAEAERLTRMEASSRLRPEDPPDPVFKFDCDPSLWPEDFVNKGSVVLTT